MDIEDVEVAMQRCCRRCRCASDHRLPVTRCVGYLCAGAVEAARVGCYGHVWCMWGNEFGCRNRVWSL